MEDPVFLIFTLNRGHYEISGYSPRVGMKIRSYRTTRSEQNFGKRVSDEGFDTSETAYTFQRNLTEYQGILKKPQKLLESPGIPENPRESSESSKIPVKIPLLLYL